MKTREQKQKDLEALIEQFKNANAAMLVSFKNMTVAKDQELRRQLREAGVDYSVVKNTLARKAAAGTPLEPLADEFKGVTAVAISTTDPVGLSKAISQFAKANTEIFSFKVGLVEGKVVELKKVEAIARGARLEDAVPDQCAGAETGNCDSGRAAQPRSRHRSGARTERSGGRVRNSNFQCRIPNGFGV